eukprot:gene1678-33073_t
MLGNLFSKETQAIFYNAKLTPVQRMLDFDYICGRTTASVACIIQPGSTGGFSKLFFGKTEIAIPFYGSIEEAARKHQKADVFINYASFRSATDSSMEALKQPTIRTVAIIAEGVPERDTKELIAYARTHNKVILGPATVGGVQAGAFKIGDTAGSLDNIIACKLHRPGSVGFVSKSGGMSNEMYNVLARATDGLFEGIAIGGDTFPGSTLSDHCLRYENIPQIKMIVILGELGGRDEYGVVEAMKAGSITKPVIAWVSGTCATLFKSEVQFGHAGARSGGEDESAQAKNAALQAAGAVVPESFEGFEESIRVTYQKLVATGQLVPAAEVPVPPIPMDLAAAVAQGMVRVPTHIVSTICDDRGEEPTYAGVSMSELIESSSGVGDVISLLWFKRKLPKYATQFIEMCIMMCADHGPCVSGAHNAIVTARAGKDIVSCLVSGLLTIGPRFGGAIDDAARFFKDACDKELTPSEFVEGLKKKGIRFFPSTKYLNYANPRGSVITRLFFPSTKYLNYAETVEEYTLQKSSNLVMNVDGCIGALFLIGYLNALFVVARSIGLVGHALDQKCMKDADQKRMKEPLYRHPWDDVLYTN